MLRLFLSSHGKFASGLKSSIEILTGADEKLTVFDAYIDQDNVKQHLDAFYKTVDENDQIILLSDLYGGSVNQQMYLYLDHPHTRLIAGVNLALVLELCTREEITDDELDHIIAQSRSMLRRVTIKQNDSERAEEDFF